MFTRQRAGIAARRGFALFPVSILGDTSRPGIGFAYDGVAPNDRAEATIVAVASVLISIIIVVPLLCGFALFLKGRPNLVSFSVS